jgi:hypothetical protein
MERSKRRPESQAAPPNAGFGQSHRFWIFGLAYFAVLLIAAVLYRPALHSPFIFDDTHLPFDTTSAPRPLSVWLSGVRPVLMFSYWVNYRLGGGDPFGYHLVNLLIHVANAVLVYFVILRVLSMAGWNRPRATAFSAVGAVVFLVHPLQTDAVSYIAGRSESLASFFMLLAFVVFLYRREESITWLEAIAVMSLFGIAVATKENAAAVAGLPVLTDLFWQRQSSNRRLRTNWRLYSLMAPASVIALFLVFRLLAGANSAGFSLHNLTWKQYGFTEARALFRYVQMTILPVGQSIDHDFPISKTIWDYGAGWFLALWAVLLVFVILLRRRLPLACFGLLMFLLLLAPTSSVVPVLDPLVERRMYLPLIGPILIGCDLLPRLRLSRPLQIGLVTTLILVYGEFCYERNTEWGNPERLFASATKECVRNMRPYVMLAEYLIRQNRCGSALPYMEEASRKTQDPTVYVSWGRVLECVGDRQGAMQKLQRAAETASDSSQMFQLIGLLYGEMDMPLEAGLALRKAVAVAPHSTTAHDALGLWYESMHDIQAAEGEYRTGAALDPNDWESRVGLARIAAIKSPSHLSGSQNFVPQ